MNRRLKQTGNRMLRASRQLLHLPQLAPVPHAFAALLTDPAELLERACHAALPAPQVAPDVFAETMPSVEFDSPNIARRASSRRVNLTAQGFKTSFAAVENATARSSNFADAGESVSVPTLPRISLPTLPNAPFQNVTARRRIDNPPFRQNIGDDSHIAPTGTASAPLHQENSSHGQTPPIAAKLPQPASGWLGKQA
ncbi:MAG TPA: hypothetical protein PKD31_24325, partial [Blastocatellia bacterium]|nr:hypothetical protein [Blastocatellia bacterium]